MTRIIDVYFVFLQYLLTTLVGLLIIPVTLQITSRYTGLIPRYIWTEEAARFLFIWIVMIGASIAVREGTHFKVDVIPQPASRWGSVVSVLIVDLSYLALAAVFVISGYRYALFGYRQTSELTGINMVAIHGVFIVAGVTWVMFVTERLLRRAPRRDGGDHDRR